MVETLLRMGVVVMTVTAGLAAREAHAAPMDFYAGVYADEGHSRSCTPVIGGSAAPVFVWAHVPEAAGVYYVTLRLRQSANLRITGRAQFSELVRNVIRIPYSDGTEEWTMFLEDCPGGWVFLYRQEIGAIDELPAAMEIVAGDSMIRDCGFELNRLEEAGSLVLNQSRCSSVPSSSTTWSAAKATYRSTP